MVHRAGKPIHSGLSKSESGEGWLQRLRLRVGQLNMRTVQRPRTRSSGSLVPHS